MASRKLSVGTGDAMFVFLEGLNMALNEDVAAAIFCDSSKAFDCLNHRILLGKYCQYVFRGVTLEWFKSYLTERRQLVRSISGQSNSMNINHGICTRSNYFPSVY